MCVFNAVQPNVKVVFGYLNRIHTYIDFYIQVQLQNNVKNEDIQNNIG